MISKDISYRIKIIGLIMICVVVFYHGGWGQLPVVNEFDQHMNDIEATILEYAGGMSMSWFFTVTSFLLFYGFSMKDYLPKVKKRVITLFVPYVLWQGIYAIFKLVTGSLDSEHILRKIFLFGAWPPHGPLWYVYTIFVCALLTPIFYLIVKNKKIGGVLIFVITLIIYRLTIYQSNFLKDIADYTYMSNVLVYIYSYFYGAYFGLHSDELKSDGVMGICISMIVGGLLMDAAWPGFFLFFLRKLIPIMLLYFMPISGKIVENRIVKTACGMTFLVYAVHPAISVITGTVIKELIFKIIPVSWISDFIGRFVNVILMFLITYLIKVVLAKVCPKLLNLLSGGRVA